MRNKTHIAFESTSLSPESTNIKFDPELNIYTFSSTEMSEKSTILCRKFLAQHNIVFKEEM